MKIIIVLLIVCLTGCTPLINISINNGGDGTKSIKGESDQAARADTKAALPVSVGAQPTSSTGTIK